MFGTHCNPAASYRWGREVSACLAFLCLTTAGFALAPCGYAENVPKHEAVDRSGELRVSSGMTLRLNTDLGNVRIQTLPQGAASVLRYSVHIETDAMSPLGQQLLDGYSLTTRETVESVFLTGTLPNTHSTVYGRHPALRNAQFWVQFVITVPAEFNLDISTGVGDIETSDITGKVALLTQGGNITSGRIGAPNAQIMSGDKLLARLETGGGHITLKNVGGDLDASTSAGHITAGNIEGNAKLRTGGGHIRAARIKGTAQLETEGGNITVGQAGAYVGVRTAGGQIDFGEVRGSVHAQTGGGGIRVMYVSGPMEVATSGGSICLTRVANTVRAATSEGTITAWITPDSLEKTGTVRLPGPSELASRTGDIVVFVPRNLSLTIDATVIAGGPEHIQADPSLPLNIQVRPDGPVHAVAALNGGGSLLKLHTASGNIHLQYVDSQMALRQSLLEEQQQRLKEKLIGYEVVPIPHAFPTPSFDNPPPGLSPNDFKDGWFEVALNRLEVIFMGSIHEDAENFKRRLTVAPPADYPALARKAGVHGWVVLQVRLKTDGTLSLEKPLEGEPALIDAAVAAIQKWRGKPEQVAGKNVEVVSTVRFNFPLQTSPRK
jgi:TonB family protein